MTSPILYAFAGLPGSGKSTLAQRLARATRAVYLRIDTLEQGLRDLCDVAVEGEGYALAMRLAGDNLRLGRDVVTDSCNPVTQSRQAWADVAQAAGACLRNIEVICSDAQEHRRRVEARPAEVPGLRLPTWAEVQGRHYDAWSEEHHRLVIDTAGSSAAEAFGALQEQLQAALEPGQATSHRVAVFFYGLFMDQAVLREAGVQALRGRRGHVADVALSIGQRAALVADPGSRAYGMVYDLTDADIHRLYDAPGLEAYRPEPVLVHSMDGAVEAALCFNLPEPPEPGGRDAQYARRLRSVLERLGFSGGGVGQP